MEEARVQSEEAERLAEASGEQEALTWILGLRVWLSYTCGGAGSIVEQARRCVDLAEKLDNENSRVWAYYALGIAYLLDAEPTAACEALRKSASIARDRCANLAALPQVLAALAEAQLAFGDRTEALASAREGIERGRVGGYRYFETGAQLALAQILLATEGDLPCAEIEAALDRAEELVTSIDGRSLSPRILELRGRLAAVLGDAQVASQVLHQALDQYREIGATGHAERLSREIAA